MSEPQSGPEHQTEDAARTAVDEHGAAEPPVDAGEDERPPDDATDDDTGQASDAEGADSQYLTRSVSNSSEENPYGPLGKPLKRHSPFYIGFFGASGAVLAVWLGGQILSISSVLILIVVALFLAIGLNPLVELFMRRGLQRTWAVLLTMLVVLVAVGLFVLAIVPVVTEQVATIAERAPDWFNQLRENNRIQRLDQEYDLIDRAEKAISDGGLTEQVFGGVLGFGLALVSALVNTFLIVVLTMYFLASLPTIKRSAYRLAPASRRARVISLGDQILENVGGYVSGAFIVALCAGFSSMIFLFLVGLGEYAVALAVVVAVLDVIPMIGATLGSVVVIAIGFATDPKIGLICLVFYIVYQQFENYVIYPRVMSRSVDISGSLIVIAALVGAALLGVVGALLAIPTAAALQLLLREVFIKRQDAL